MRPSATVKYTSKTHSNQAKLSQSSSAQIGRAPLTRIVEFRTTRVFLANALERITPYIPSFQSPQLLATPPYSPPCRSLSNVWSHRAFITKAASNRRPSPLVLLHFLLALTPPLYQTVAVLNRPMKTLEDPPNHSASQSSSTDGARSSRNFLEGLVLHPRDVEK